MSTYNADSGEQRYTQAEQATILTRTTAASGSTTSGSAVITHGSGNFTKDDIGRTITGAGIPANTVILSWQSPTQVTLSANATATASNVAFTISEPVVQASGGQGAVEVTTVNNPNGSVRAFRWWPLAGHAGEARVRF